MKKTKRFLVLLFALAVTFGLAACGKTSEQTVDFICGMDVSSMLAEEESGVVYYNEAGEQADLFEVLSDAGINYIRVRV